jgi:transposase
LDAKLIAEVLTKKVAQLPQITKGELSTRMLNLKRLVWYYEEITVQGARLKKQLHKLQREQELCTTKKECAMVSFIAGQKQKELTKIKKIQQSLKTKLAALLIPEGMNLTSIPGVSIVLAAKIAAYTNGIHRFANRDKFLQYAGIGLLEKSSGKR